MVRLQRLAAFLDDYLEAGEGKDYCPNGLQVEGRSDVGKLITGVSACEELFARAEEAGGDALLVHHGLFWEGDPRSLTGFRYRRVARLIRSGLGLLAYHLPLDRHPEVGNNAVAARELGLGSVEPFGDLGDLPVGCKGRFDPPLTPEELLERCRRLFRQEPLVLGDGDAPVASLAIVSGAAQKTFYQAVDEGLDAFLTGEASEWVQNVARETATTYLAAGHHATERLGVQTLGDHLARELDLEVEFIDVPNPV